YLLRPDSNGDVLGVDHQDRLSFRPLQRFIQSRNAEICQVAFRVFQSKRADLGKRMVRDLACSAGRAIERWIVHQYNVSVPGISRINLEDCGTMRQRVFESRNAVLGKTLPGSAAVSADKRQPVGRIAEKAL